jgi:hypothetical protein
VVGFNGTAAGGTLPDDGTIQIAFDRLLDPASVTRQSFSLSDDSGNYPEEVITYDPILRVVTLSTNSGGAWLTQGATYKVVMGQAAASDTTGLTGPKAIDGATLTASVVETFQAVASAGTESEYRAMDLCNDVLPVFQNDCSSTNCHGHQPRLPGVEHRRAGGRRNGCGRRPLRRRHAHHRPRQPGQ